MKYVLLSLLLTFSLTNQAHWLELKYDSSAECYNTGIKRVLVPFPGFGSIACLKDAVKQLPDYEKSASLLAGHTVGLITAGLATSIVLVIAAWLKMPEAENILGPTLTDYLITIPKQALKKPDRCK